MSAANSFRLFALLLFGLATTPTSLAARSWDLAVTIGKEVDFLSRNGTAVGHAKVAQSVALRSIAYDDATHTIYLSDSRTGNVSIYSNGLKDKSAKPRPVLKNNNGAIILEMAFDPESRTLFWIDMDAIMKMHVPLDGPADDPQLLHDLSQKTPRGIALDICNRHIYWANGERSNTTIERSNLDGTDRTLIVSSNIYDLTGIAMDHTTAKLYWIDDLEGIYYKVERSNLDGSERELVVHNKHQVPAHIAVDRDTVYWLDYSYRAVWRIRKDVVAGDAPTEFKSYFDSHPSEDPTSIIARDNHGSVDCPAMFRTERENRAKARTPQDSPESYVNLTTSTEEIDSTGRERETTLCLNGGAYSEIEASCRCKSGFEGANCETSLCQNYCIQGHCVIDAVGLPQCECKSGYSGRRCEKYICDGYCLNNGRCSVRSGEPFCSCQSSRGSRCEDARSTEEICTLFCASGETAVGSIDASSCSCAEYNRTMEPGAEYSESFGATILMPVLMALIGVLTVIVAVLSYQISKLRRRPRIKKRFVVSKSGVTPLTSRPQIPGDQCEITIENCCNMNICETPCFEPQLRSAPSKNSNTKREEKNALLDSMEGADSC